jgi:hypothetical protein
MNKILQSDLSLESDFPDWLGSGEVTFDINGFINSLIQRASYFLSAFKGTP